MKKIKDQQNSAQMIINPLPASILAAVSLAVLITLAFWKFELRSIFRLGWQSAALSFVLWAGVYYLIYRKHQLTATIHIAALIISAAASIFLSAHVVPFHESSTRTAMAVAAASIAFLGFFLICLPTIFQSGKVGTTKVFTSMVILLGVAGMSIIFINSLSVRMYSDDFFYAVQLDQMGLWRAALWFYNNWSASFFSNFLIMGLSHQRSTVSLFLILATLSLFASRVLATGKNTSQRWLSSAAIAFFIPLAVLTVTPDMYKSLFWVCSSLSLLPLLIFIPIYLALIARLLTGWQPATKIMMVLAALVSFALSTTHEVASLGWLGMHIFGIIWTYLTRKKSDDLKKFLIAGLAGTLIGLAVLLTSPGVDARVAKQNYPPPPPLTEVIPATIQDFLDFLVMVSAPYYRYHGDFRPGWYMIIAAAGLGWLSDTPLRRSFTDAALVLILTVGMTAISFFPGAYIMSMPIPFRTQFIPSMYLVVGAFLFGLLLPCATQKQTRDSFAIFLFLVLFFGSRTSIQQLLLTMEPVRQYAADWDARDALIRSTGKKPERIEVPWDEYEQNLGHIRLYYKHITASR